MDLSPIVSFLLHATLAAPAAAVVGLVVSLAGRRRELPQQVHGPLNTGVPAHAPTVEALAAIARAKGASPAPVTGVPAAPVAARRVRAGTQQQAFSKVD